ncbi:hypothetical protein ACJ72_08044 [Emergomyces africanus]|uniref:Uncharacterized protein n=1 Tax=Emergomyces africanus TaxID=1955775 RepID=A0A1B7NLI5_9EURO|nr:hypothetical protein ACJ72_08044 [Emergomyces africanus]
MAPRASKFTELLDSDKLQQHTFSAADARLEDILAAEAAHAAAAAAATPSRRRFATDVGIADEISVEEDFVSQSIVRVYRHP